MHRKRRTGQSRTTVWRKKRKLGKMCEEDDDPNPTDPCLCPYHQQLLEIEHAHAESDTESNSSTSAGINLGSSSIQFKDVPTTSSNSRIDKDTCQAGPCGEIRLNTGDCTAHSSGWMSSDINMPPINPDGERSLSKGKVPSSSSDEEFSDIEGSFEMHCLDLEANNIGESSGSDADQDEIYRDPIDVEPSSSDSSAVDSDTSSDSENDAGPIINENLNIIPQNRKTVKEILFLNLALAVRHNWSFECIIDSMAEKNFCYGVRRLPTSKKELWRVLRLSDIKLLAHIYCGRQECGQYIQKKELLGEFAECTCGYRIATNKAKFFITMSLKRQLMWLLSIPGISEHLQYPLRRQKRVHDAIEDVFDGSVYKALQRDGEILSSPYQFTYVFNTDGCAISKGAKLKMWPIFLRINELPPALRQKFSILAGIYVDKSDPTDFQSFLEPFVKQANCLSRKGITWKPDGIQEVVSKFYPLCHCVDAVARNGILNMAKFNSNFGCTYCTFRGVYAGGSMRYPIQPHPEIPLYGDRTHNGMIEDMLEAHRTGTPVRGHKGLTQLMLLNCYDLRQGQATDDLHPDHEGCASDITDLLITVAPRVPREMSREALLSAIDNRLKSIKTPSRISRKVSSIRGRGSWKGSEYRNWLLFYGVPCMTGLISQQYVDLFSMFSYASFLLSQDAISPNDIDSAERCIVQYVTRFEQRFGLEKTKYNLHVLTHKAKCVRELGPPWTYSTYNFESLNGRLVKNVTSPQGAALQVVKRYLLYQMVSSSVYNIDFPPTTRELLKEILSKKKMTQSRQIWDHSYVLGKGKRRALTYDERQVLENEGFHQVCSVDDYDRLRIGACSYKSVRVQKQSDLSDDTFIYTWENTYCTIQSIVIFEHNNGEESSGLFVMEHDVERTLQHARHVSILHSPERDLLHFIRISQVRCPAICMNVNDVVYVAPLPNVNEID